MALKINGITVSGRGRDGKAAYETAQESGYTGTKTEFNTLLANIGSHASRHHADGEDPLTPEAIGAAAADMSNVDMDALKDSILSSWELVTSTSISGTGATEVVPAESLDFADIDEIMVEFIGTLSAYTEDSVTGWLTFGSQVTSGTSYTSSGLAVLTGSWSSTNNGSISCDYAQRVIYKQRLCTASSTDRTLNFTRVAGTHSIEVDTVSQDDWHNTSAIKVYAQTASAEGTVNIYVKRKVM